MEQFKKKCDIAYENGEPIIDDVAYDTIFGEDASAITTSTKSQTATLPFYMGSLNKVKTEKKLLLWLNKNKCNSFVVSPKLDGISALYYKNKLFTRGNGTTGTDITAFIKYLKIGNIEQIMRGELVVKKKIFDQKYRTRKSGKEFKSARNLVAGQFNKKTIDDSIIKDIDFVAHEIITEEHNTQLLPSIQFDMLSSRSVALNYLKIDRQQVTINKLNKILEEFVTLSEYQIDGLVITADEPYIRNIEGNPKYSIAFKKNYDANIESSIAKVTKIQWELSKWGFFIPIVHIEPVELSGCTISKLTGHNAKYIVENKIEEGAEIICIRSGDVIPYIVDVVKPSVKEIKLPSACWDGAHLKQPINGIIKSIEIKILTSLLKKLDVKDISLKTTEKLYNCFDNESKIKGLDVFFKILECEETFFSQHFKDKTLLKIYSEISNLKSRNISTSKLISSSGILGYGIAEKRIELLLTSIPNFFVQKPTIEELCKIEGFSFKLAQKILDNYTNMTDFINACNNSVLKNQNNESNVSNDSVSRQCSSSKLKICLSGFRDKTLENKYTVLNSITKQCELLIVLDETSNSTKIKQAKKLNIPIVSKLLFYKTHPQIQTTNTN